MTTRTPKDTGPDLESLRENVDGWYNVKRQAAALTRKLDEGKKSFKALVEKFGTTNPEDGHVYLDLGVPVGDRKIRVLKNQQSVTRHLNQEAAEKILKRKGLWDEVSHDETYRVYDEDAIRAAHFEKKLTVNDLAQIFPQVISYSFWLLDNEGKPVS